MLPGVVDLDEAWRLEAVLGNTGDVAHRVLDAAAVAAELLVDHRDQPADQRAHDESDQGEARVHPQQECDRADDGERTAQRDDDRVGRGLADLLAVVGEARQQRTGRAAVEIADRQPQDVTEHLRAQPGNDAAAHVAHEIGLSEVSEPAQQKQADQCHRQPDDGARILMLQRAVAEYLGVQREGGIAGGEQHCAQYSERKAATVGSDIPEEPAVGPQRAVARGRHAAGAGRRSRAVVQGLPAGPSLTVAMLTSANPSRPSTSMAVMTDWWVARASARSVTRTPRLLPTSLSSAARSVSGEELMSSC